MAASGRHYNTGGADVGRAISFVASLVLVMNDLNILAVTTVLVLHVGSCWSEHVWLHVPRYSCFMILRRLYNARGWGVGGRWAPRPQGTKKLPWRRFVFFCKTDKVDAAICSINFGHMPNWSDSSVYFLSGAIKLRSIRQPRKQFQGWWATDIWIAFLWCQSETHNVRNLLCLCSTGEHTNAFTSS